MSAYLATFTALALLQLLPRYWIALAGAAVATLVTVAVIEGGRWSVGLLAPPLTAVRELVLGLAVGGAVIAITDRLIVSSTDLRHVAGAGFPWAELLTVFLPAAVHEELLFRGYLFQRVRLWNRPAAIVLSSGVFAFLHVGNSGATLLAIANLAGAGVLLAFAYELYGRLLIPIGIHLAWNVVSGPLLGYGVSGYAEESTVWRLRGVGADWLTGGRFGIEGSLWITLVEGIAVLLLALALRRCKMRPAE